MESKIWPKNVSFPLGFFGLQIHWNRRRHFDDFDNSRKFIRNRYISPRSIPTLEGLRNLGTANASLTKVVHLGIIVYYELSRTVESIFSSPFHQRKSKTNAKFWQRSNTFVPLGLPAYLVRRRIYILDNLDEVHKFANFFSEKAISPRHSSLC